MLPTVLPPERLTAPRRTLPTVRSSNLRMALPKALRMTLPRVWPTDPRMALPMVLLSVLLALSMTLQAQEDRIPVVPYPQQVTMEGGAFDPSREEVNLRISGIGAPAAGILTAQLATHFDERFQAAVTPTSNRRPDVWIGLPSEDPELEEAAAKEGLMPDKGLGEEGYLLRIGKKQILIVANGQAGAFYGVQTLVQLLRGFPVTEALPGMTIRDYPSIGFRCVMDDISRGPIPTMEYMKMQVRRYAEMKINHMSFYIEHVVRTETYPDFAPSNGGISVEEFAALSEYAAGYHIRLVGNFQSLGHFEKILSFPQFRHLGATERMIDPLNPESIEFLGAVYREMAPVFSSPIFTPNLDEAWDLSRGGLQGAAAVMGPARIYAGHATRIDSVLRSLDKRTLIWGDIILQYPEIMEMIPGDVILGAWNYSPEESFAGYIDPLVEAGFDFTVSPGVLNSNRLIPDFRMTTTNIRNFINEGYEKGALGVYCTVWDDGGMHFFNHTWYGVAYSAEQSWRPNREPMDDFDRRFSRGVYGDQQNLIPRALHAINHLTDLGPTFEMNSNVFNKTLVPERGDKVTFDPGSWEEVRRWTRESREILTGGYTPWYDRDLAYIKFTLSQYEFLADARTELLNAAGAYNAAAGLQRTDRPAALLKLEEARDVIGSLRLRYAAIRSQFSILWDMESRPYWKDRGLIEYDVHMEGFNDQMDLLEKAIAGFREGDYLPPPTEVRLDIRRRSGQFFPYWLMVGSFTLPTFDAYTHDFLEPMGGEASARPYPGEKFTDENGIERMWDKYDAPRPPEVNLREIFEPKITAVAYAYCTIDTPEDMQVTALLGSNDGAAVWCNGEQVHRVHMKRSLIPDEDQIPLDLKKGRNHLLLKVEQWKGDWGFSFRLKDVEVRNHKQKYYIQD